MKNIALIFAGGIGRRMNNNALPKQFLKLHGKEIIIHTINKFERCDNIDSIVVVCVQEWIPYLNDIISLNGIVKVKSVVSGGKSGQESIYNGLKEIQRLFGTNDITVLIHDGVRPLINDKLINDNIMSVHEHGNAISAAKATETVVLDSVNKIDKIIDRGKSWIAKAPQSFRLSDIIKCHEDARQKGKNDYIDSASLMSEYGYSLKIVECSVDNIKITTPSDYYIFRAIFEKEENEQLL